MMSEWAVRLSAVWSSFTLLDWLVTTELPVSIDALADSLATILEDCWTAPEDRSVLLSLWGGRGLVCTRFIGDR